MADWIDKLWQDVLELPDRTSPADYPEMALVTGEELRQLIGKQEDAENCTVTVGRCLQVRGTWEAIKRVQAYILLDTTHPVEIVDNARAMARALQAAEAEILYWRATAAATLSMLQIEAKIEDKDGNAERADHIRWRYITPMLNAARTAIAGDLADVHCEGCNKGIEEGEAVFAISDDDGDGGATGEIHVDCDDPAKADPLPEHAFRHQDYWTDAVVARDLAEVEAYMAGHADPEDVAEVEASPWPLLSALKVGDKLKADAGFTCLADGAEVEVQALDDGSLFIACSEGEHHLDGQKDDATGRLTGLTLVPAPPQAGLEDPDAERCIACAKPFVIGDRYLHDVGGGSLHFECCAEDSYVHLESGEPLQPGEPPPVAEIWIGDRVEPIDRAMFEEIIFQLYRASCSDREEAIVRGYADKDLADLEEQRGAKFGEGRHDWSARFAAGYAETILDQMSAGSDR